MILKNLFIFFYAAVISSACGASDVDIEFKGKKLLQYNELCSAPGVKFKGAGYSSAWKYECKPNFSSYAGESLINYNNDACDSKILYNNFNGRVVDIYLSYPDSASDNLLLVLSKKYGRVKNLFENTFQDESFNFKYTWSNYSGLIDLDKLNARTNEGVNSNKGRRCTVMRIKTSVMFEEDISMTDKYKAERNKKIKDAASKL